MLATRNTTACARVHHSSTTASQRRVLSAEAAFQAGLPTLDAIDLVATLRKRVSTLRTAFRAGLQLVADDSFADSSLRERKLFYLAARMLLHRTPAEARIPTAELERRCELFRRGEWLCLLTAAGAARLRLEAACGRWDACSREPAPLPRLLRSAQLHGQPGCSAVERPRCCCCAAGACNHVFRAAATCTALCCRTSTRLARARRRPLDQRISAEPRRAPPITAE